jgi:hypothetical protein
MKAWHRNEQRRAFLAELRAAMGDVVGDSPLSEWLTWAERYIRVADPMERFRKRETMLKMYFSCNESELERIREDGFSEPGLPAAYAREEQSPPGIRLKDAPGGECYYSKSMELELPEDAVLPYEVTVPGYVPRVFCVPARVLNRLIGHRGLFPERACRTPGDEPA